MASANATLKNLVHAARLWLRARVVYRQLLDKRSAKPADVEKAKEALLQRTNELEVAVMSFEKLYASMQKRGAKKDLQVPWSSIFKVVATGAGVVAQALDDKPGAVPPKPAIPIDVIDVEGVTTYSKKQGG